MLKMLHLTNLPAGPPEKPADKPRELKDPRSPRFLFTVIGLVVVVGLIWFATADPFDPMPETPQASISQSAAPVVDNTAELCHAIDVAARGSDSAGFVEAVNNMAREATNPEAQAAASAYATDIAEADLTGANQTVEVLFGICHPGVPFQRAT